MYDVLTKLTTLYGWNRRVWDWEDFEEFCRLDGVIIFPCRTSHLGEYMVVQGQPVIALEQTLRKPFKLWVAFHELAHHWLHSPEAGFFYGNASKEERQADIVSSCALIPLPILKSRSPDQVFDDFDYPADLIETRWEVNRKYGY